MKRGLLGPFNKQIDDLICTLVTIRSLSEYKKDSITKRLINDAIHQVSIIDFLAKADLKTKSERRQRQDEKRNR